MEKHDEIAALIEGSIPETERIRYATEVTHSDSTFEEYEQWLEINTDELIGKKVLDIGGMPNGKFAKKARLKGIDLVTLNPSISEIVKERKIKGRGAVAAYVQQLPFKAETFDFEIAYGSVPSNLAQLEKEYLDTFEEIYRTLKIGGKAYMVPVYEPAAKTEIFNKMMSSLAQKGLNTNLEHVGFVVDKNDKKIKVYKLTMEKVK